MRKRLLLLAALFTAGAVLSVHAQSPMSVPEDFPRFEVPGYEREMATLRALYWRHYPSAGPKATLWDEWLAGPSLWPATDHDDLRNKLRAQWRDALSRRILDDEGYVATHQHISIAHQQGWPFPFWNQGIGGFGWHFSLVGVPPGFGPTHIEKPEGWVLEGAVDNGVARDTWNLTLTQPNATIIAQDGRWTLDAFNIPFIQLRWRAAGLGNAQPYLEWTTPDAPRFGPDRRVYFAPTQGDAMTYTMIPLYRHPRWTGRILRLRIGFGNQAAGGTIGIQAFFSNYDTRHNINNQSFITGCATYFRWTGDLNFLRENIGRMRLALRYLGAVLGGDRSALIVTPWVGHSGRSALFFSSDNKKHLRVGDGIGNNYWDLLPFGGEDCYATLRYYGALREMALIEREIAAHPEWNIPGGTLALDPQDLEKRAARVKAAGNRRFWNTRTDRFVACIDRDGQAHDYGYTFLNLEAVYYGFATDAHARQILRWISGERIVAGDTARGADIYHWRFAPRASTRRNIDWYGWYWNAPETIPWGGQVQDGGAVLGFSYHDLMARLKTRGPDDAWSRLREIIRWFDDVQAAGGYRKYYDGTRDGTLQGGGTAGGLGMDEEFFESVLVPQVMLHGFLGFTPTADGFRVRPRLPRDWPGLTIDRIRLRELVLRVTATSRAIAVRKEGETDAPLYVDLPAGFERVVYLSRDERTLREEPIRRRGRDGAAEIVWGDAAGVRFERGARQLEQR